MENKPDKGCEGGSCNRTACQAPNAIWYNHGSLSWYCEACANLIGNDVVNLADWMLNFYVKCGHPQFETRAMIDARERLDLVMASIVKDIDERFLK